jgi:peptidyl-prolyl cis-trans isomerase A (cyclophilin A)
VRKILFILCILFIPSLIWAEGPSKKAVENPVCIMKTSMGDVWLELWPDAAPKTVENFIGLAEGKKEFIEVKNIPAASSSTSKNSIELRKAKRPFYDGLIFHRVIKDYMIQGGRQIGKGGSSPGYKFDHEINADALGLDKIKAVNGKKTHPYLGIRSQIGFERKIIYPLTKKMGAKTVAEHRALWDEAIKKLPSLSLKDCYENLGYKYDPNLPSRHLLKGVLAMASSGPNTNGSQFFICLKDTPWLDGKHTAFGKVIKGFEVVEKIGNVEVDKGKKPVVDVKIISIRLEAR